MKTKTAEQKVKDQRYLLLVKFAKLFSNHTFGNDHNIVAEIIKFKRMARQALRCDELERCLTVSQQEKITLDNQTSLG